ncbi:MAG: GNAT family N-acetyltransferase [Treponemataceae bacterium]|nr:GNAT family N-acetyltransferase [Treponemataceae bacterium]
MKVIEYFDSRDSSHWLNQMQKCDWRAGQYLCELLRESTFKNIFGEKSKVLLLVDGRELVSFCTYSEIDDIQPTDLTPWIGFVYTFPAYRNRGCAGKMLKHCERLAKNDKVEAVYISTNHVDFYEKYGYEFYKTMEDIAGECSRVYRKRI